MSPDPAPEDVLLVFVTAPDTEVAARLAHALVEERLAACVSIVPGLRSIYVFDGKLCDDAEVLCLIKTQRASYPALRDRVGALHPYQVPEIIGIALAEGNAPYLRWLLTSTAAH